MCRGIIKKKKKKKKKRKCYPKRKRRFGAHSMDVQSLKKQKQNKTTKQNKTKTKTKTLFGTLKGTNGRQKTCEIFHVYCIFYSGFMCQTTVIFGITKDRSLVLNPLAS